jgi:hypothetical protein
MTARSYAECLLAAATVSAIALVGVAVLADSPPPAVAAYVEIPQKTVTVAECSTEKPPYCSEDGDLSDEVRAEINDRFDRIEQRGRYSRPPLHPYFTSNCDEIPNFDESGSCRQAQWMLWPRVEASSWAVLRCLARPFDKCVVQGPTIYPIGSLTQADADRAIDWAYEYARNHAYEYLRSVGHTASTIKIMTGYAQR